VELSYVARKFSGIVVLTALLSSFGAHADIYVYELPAGTRIVTDHVLNYQHYQLIGKSSTVKGIGKFLASPSVLADPAAYDKLIRETAALHRVDPALVKAVVHAESAFNPNALSRKGASGLMQLMPATARRYGVKDIFDPTQNVQGGVRYLKDLLRQFNYNHRLVAAAYNAGENAVIRFKGIPPYNETQDYVRKVMQFKTEYTIFNTADTGALPQS
jgi:soluble lytic murein transglycosylase-like protein